jgi:hypothetical protein
MKLWILSLFGMLLFGCVAPGPTPESLAQYAQRVCAATQTSPEIREEFMRRCVAMEMGTGPGPSMPYAMPSYAPLPIYQSPSRNGYGQPDAFGPYGVWGPTWQSFNGAFQEPPPRH